MGHEQPVVLCQSALTAVIQIVEQILSVGHELIDTSSDEQPASALKGLWQAPGDYKVVQLTALESTAGLRTAEQVLRLVAGARGLSLEGLP